MNLNSIPAFDDNYIWVLNDEAGRCLIVDPGDAEPVLNAIAANNWQPEAIFLTHHHHDHVGGVKELVEKFPQIVVYGPQETQDKGTTQVVKSAKKHLCHALCCRTTCGKDLTAGVFCEHRPGITTWGTVKY
ncbi:MBL fold metallo-hydrolase, partial [Escherichia coli]|uniref:MBL fold metallo-hydrolase n=1 Tax=Escherichia coli TaxID=562 RepID=UPI0020772592